MKATVVAGCGTVKTHEFLHLHLHVLICNNNYNIHSWNNKRYGELKMKGYIIDCRYVIRVCDLMECLKLPYPRRKNELINDGERLPIITVECEV